MSDEKAIIHYDPKLLLKAFGITLTGVRKVDAEAFKKLQVLKYAYKNSETKHWVLSAKGLKYLDEMRNQFEFETQVEYLCAPCLQCVHYKKDHTTICTSLCQTYARIMMQDCFELQDTINPDTKPYFISKSEIDKCVSFFNMKGLSDRDSIIHHMNAMFFDEIEGNKNYKINNKDEIIRTVMLRIDAVGEENDE